MDAIDIDVLRDEIFQDTKDPKIKVKVTQLARKAKQALEAGQDGEAKKIASQMQHLADAGAEKGPELKAPGQDLDHDKAIALKKVEDPIVAGKREMSSIKGSIANIMKDRRSLEASLPPEEFQKFKDEIKEYQDKAKVLAQLIKQASSKKEVRHLDGIAKSYVNYVRNNLHGKYKNALDNRVWASPEKPVEPGAEPVAAEPKSREQSLADLKGDVDSWFAQQGIDVSEFGVDPDSEIADDPEGNEVLADPDDLDRMAATEEDFATKIRGMMSESFDQSYREATKKLL